MDKDVAVAVALIAAVASVCAAALGAAGVILAKGNRTRLSTENGHTIGQSATRQEDMLLTLLNRTDRLEVRQDENITNLKDHIAQAAQTVAEGRVLRNWVVEQMEKKEP